MLKNKLLLYRKTGFFLLLVFVFCWTSVVQAKRPSWKRKEVDWRMTGGWRIKAINYPDEKPPPLLRNQRGRRRKGPRKKTLPPQAASRVTVLSQEPVAPLIAMVFDSPPIDGFVPWVAVSVTDKRHPEMNMRFDANDTNNVLGSFPNPVDPQADYVLGIFDSGASACVMGNAAAIQAGLFYPDQDNDLLTSNTIEIAGVTSSVDAWVSQPLGLFIDGLGAIDSNGLLVDNSGMVGMWNVAMAVGQGGLPDLITAIGMPLAVYFAVDFRNDLQITVTYDSNDVNSPDIHFYSLSDSAIPSYSNLIPLELRPLGGLDVRYVATLDPFTFEFIPASPSIIVGNLSQSVYFVHSVDLTEGQEMAYDRDRFMFDTGAQVTVIGSRVAARLALNPDSNDFTVVIKGVTGDSVIAPGFYIDSLEIPALGEWLSFTNVPVILFDVSSPEGGTVDGIIGMNLFVDLNFVLRGGGLFLQPDPSLEFEPFPPCQVTGDIAPQGGDCKVDYLDLAEFANHWLETSTSPNWNPECDMAPQPTPDEKADFLDFAMLAGHWLEGTTP
ncbi:MAG: aspartyl protease family protein [Planctomycetota bacterium]|jgi:predicted aspartyl protease